MNCRYVFGSQEGRCRLLNLSLSDFDFLAVVESLYQGIALDSNRSRTLELDMFRRELRKFRKLLGKPRNIFRILIFRGECSFCDRNGMLKIGRSGCRRFLYVHLRIARNGVR